MSRIDDWKRCEMIEMWSLQAGQVQWFERLSLGFAFSTSWMYWTKSGSRLSDFRCSLFEPWSFRAYHGQFVGSRPSSSSWDSSATMPWGLTSPSPSSRWSGLQDDLNQIISRWAIAQAPRCGRCKTILQFLGAPRIELWSLVLSSTAMSSSRCLLPFDEETLTSIKKSGAWGTVGRNVW